MKARKTSRWGTLRGIHILLLTLYTTSAATSSAGAHQGSVGAIEMTGVHYRPGEGSFADAIPFFWEGTYHVFYLRGGIGGCTWEHLSSADLVNWKEHPTALAPGEPDAPDGESIFTGSVLERDGRFHAFYTGWNPKHPSHREQIMHATSQDLNAWTKHPQHTFHADGKTYQDNDGKDFRDPFVFWNARAKEYWMLLYARRTSDGRGVIGRYGSDNLTTWQPMPPLNCGSAGECPDLFPIGDRWYLLMSRGGMWAASSERLDGRYEPPKVAHLDTPMLYAVKRLFDGERHIGFGFVRDLKDESDFGNMLWGGTMCLPREIYEAEAGRLEVRPVDEVVRAFSHKVWDLETQPSPQVRAGEWKYDGSVLHAKGDHVAAAFSVPRDYMLLLEAKPSPIGKMIVRFRDQGPAGGGYSLAIDMLHQTTELRGPLYTYERGTPIDRDKPVRVRAFAHGTILECFVNDAHAFTSRCYDFPDGDLSIQANDGRLAMKRLEVWQLP